MADFLITEYSETKKTAQQLASDFLSAKDQKSSDDNDNDNDEDTLVISFEEPEEDTESGVLVLPMANVIEFSEESDPIFDMSQGVSLHSNEDESDAFRLPGAMNYTDDDDDENEEVDAEEVATDWINDRDPKYFMEYIKSVYPDGIPSHDGTSTLGCERAILFITKINKELSEALRADKDDVLNLPVLENMRVNMIRDIVTLKEHAKKLNKKHKKGEDNSKLLNKSAELRKEATTPIIQLVMTPWERAITGIIINAVVSSGKPFEDVYDFLKKKYKFSEREELTILQLLMDMGHPIFKDRGSLGSEGDNNDGHGVDFIKNYFA